MAERWVLDASAILCLIHDEPGADVVLAALPDSVVSAVNLAEVVAKMVELGLDAPLIATVLEPLQLQVIAFDASQAEASGLLRGPTRSLGLSLGDRACLALTAHLGATALTTDRAWASIGDRAKVAFAR